MGSLERKKERKKEKKVIKREGYIVFLFIALFFLSRISIISPTSCGFAKVAVFNLLNKINASANNGFQHKSRNEDLRHHFDEFNKQFIGYNENFNVQYRTFHTFSPKILGTLKSLQKRRSVDKATVMDVFSKGME